MGGIKKTLEMDRESGGIEHIQLTVQPKGLNRERIIIKTHSNVESFWILNRALLFYVILKMMSLCVICYVG